MKNRTIATTHAASPHASNPMFMLSPRTKQSGRPARTTERHNIIIMSSQKYFAKIGRDLFHLSADRRTFSTNKMRFITALLVLNAAATAVAFAPPAGHGTSGVRGEAALGAKRDFLRRIFRRPSRLAAKVRMIFFFMVRVRFAFLAFLA